MILSEGEMPPWVVHTEGRPRVVVMPFRQQVLERSEGIPIQMFALLNDSHHVFFTAGSDHEKPTPSGRGRSTLPTRIC